MICSVLEDDAGCCLESPVAAARRDLLALTRLSPALPTPHAMEAFPDDVLIAPATGDLTLPNRQIAATLKTDLEERYATACRTGVMSFPSPVDGAELGEVRGFVLSHVLALWRCVDRRNGLVFFIAASGFGSACTTLWLPGAGLYLHVTGLESGRIDLTAGGYVKAMVDHLFEHGQDLLEFLHRPVGRFAQFTWPPPSLHIGRYHWNELPGLERIVEVVEPHDYPLIYDLGGGSGNSFYGRLSSLFPSCPTGSICPVPVSRTCRRMPIPAASSCSASAATMSPAGFAGGSRTSSP